MKNEGVPPIKWNGVLDGTFDELTYEAQFLAPFIGSGKGVVFDLSGKLRWNGVLLADKINFSGKLPGSGKNIILAEDAGAWKGRLESEYFAAT